jgi:hypothetical protein
VDIKSAFGSDLTSYDIEESLVAAYMNILRLMLGSSYPSQDILQGIFKGTVARDGF